jgi:DNA (cytosine-5)-methyltransferase 1
MLIIDLFAGGGGASEGIKMASGRDPDIAVNHDKIALSVHKANHPKTKHYEEDVWKVPPRRAVGSNSVGLLWCSPDCRHFSKAKGSAPIRSLEIRSLAWAVKKWAREVRPRVIILENVEEFINWGPLNSEGKIIKEHKGDTFRSFVKRLKRLGYKVEWKELRACEYGAPTIRKRLFLIARCDGLPIVWPEPTHGPGKTPYRTAADIIDWDIPCPSIFERKKPLVENTMKRIAKGIERYVINAADPFIVTYYGPKKGEKFRGQSIRDPLRTQTTENRFGLVIPHIQKQFSHSVGHSINNPIGAITGKNKTALVSAHIQRQFGMSVGSSMNDPIGTVMSDGLGKTALVTAFMAQHNGGFYDGPGRSLKVPISTVTNSGSQQQVVTSHLLKYDQKTGKLTANKNHTEEVRAFLLKYYGTDQDPRLKEPIHTITTKDRFGLVTVNIQGEPYIITDIGMRMLSPRELFRAQGFSDDYMIDIKIDDKKITKTYQVKLCGNSVSPQNACALVKANAGFLSIKDEKQFSKVI